MIEERSLSNALRLTSHIDGSLNGEGTSRMEENAQQHLDCLKDDDKRNNEQLNLENIHNGANDPSDFKGTGSELPINHNNNEKEEQRPSEEDEMLDDTKGGLSSEIDLDAEWIFSMSDEKTQLMNNTNRQGSPEKANDSNNVKNKVSGLDGTDIGVSKQISKETDRRQSLRQRKKLEKKEPVRSSQRTCKKILDTTCSEEEEKEPGKKDFCLYCKMSFTQLAKHLEKKHAEETDVAHAIHFPRGSKVRQSLLDQIRNEGNYEHNCRLLKSGEWENVTKRLLKNPNVPVRDFLPCQYCRAFYRRTELWRHERSCKARKGEEKPTEKLEVASSGASRLPPMSEILTEGCEEIIQVMHQDDISRHIRNDPLICKYGNALSAKYDHDKSQFAYIAQKMRELGRFVLAVNELDKSVKYLHEVCQPSKFQLAVKGAKKLSGFDPDSRTFKTVSLITKIGYSLKRAAEIAFGESRMTEDSESESEVKTFIELLDTTWSECFSRTAFASSIKPEVKILDRSFVTDDLIKLRRFITTEEEEARRDLKITPSLSTWKKLSEATLADICLFNRARVGNIGRLLLQTYNCRKRNEASVLSADHVRKCTKLELELGTLLTRLELEGQFGRNMLVLLTERMVLSIDLLNEKRYLVGVSPTNPYLFARNEGPSFIRALDCFRRAAVESGVKNPEALLSSSAREQIATCWQLMSLNRCELDLVAKLAGRSSQECYSLSRNTSQLEEVSKVLMKMERSSQSKSPTAAKDGESVIVRPSKLCISMSDFRTIYSF